MHITVEQSSAFKRLLESLLLAIKMCTGFTTDVIWVNTRVCSVTSRLKLFLSGGIFLLGDGNLRKSDFDHSKLFAVLAANDQRKKKEIYIITFLR